MSRAESDADSSSGASSSESDSEPDVQQSSASESDSESGSESGSDSGSSSGSGSDSESESDAAAREAEAERKRAMRRERNLKKKAFKANMSATPLPAPAAVARAAAAIPAAASTGPQPSKLLNRLIATLQPDYYYHLGLSSALPLKTMFGDVRFVLLSGSPVRAAETAQKLQTALGVTVPTGCTLAPIGKTERYSLYKVGPVLSVSHGMGKPSIIMLHELTKMLAAAGVLDKTTYIRIGTSGGVGVDPGTVVVSTGTVNGALEPSFPVVILGQTVHRPCYIQPALVEEIMAAATPAGEKLNYQVLRGVTMATDDFYEGQGRLDGAIAEYTLEDKMAFLQKAHAAGVKNIEMESDAIVAFCTKLRIRCAVVCCAILNRLLGDQVLSTPAQLVEFADNAVQVAIRFIQKQLNLPSSKADSVSGEKGAHGSKSAMKAAARIGAGAKAVPHVAGSGTDFIRDQLAQPHTGAPHTPKRAKQPQQAGQSQSAKKHANGNSKPAAQTPSKKGSQTAPNTPAGSKKKQKPANKQSQQPQTPKSKQPKQAPATPAAAAAAATPAIAAAAPATPAAAPVSLVAKAEAAAAKLAAKAASALEKAESKSVADEAKAAAKLAKAAEKTAAKSEKDAAKAKAKDDAAAEKAQTKAAKDAAKSDKKKSAAAAAAPATPAAAPEATTATPNKKQRKEQERAAKAAAAAAAGSAATETSSSSSTKKKDAKSKDATAPAAPSTPAKPAAAPAAAAGADGSVPQNRRGKKRAAAEAALAAEAAAAKKAADDAAMIAANRAADIAKFFPDTPFPKVKRPNKNERAAIKQKLIEEAKLQGATPAKAAVDSAAAGDKRKHEASAAKADEPAANGTAPSEKKSKKQKK